MTIYVFEKGDFAETIASMNDKQWSVRFSLVASKRGREKSVLNRSELS